MEEIARKNLDASDISHWVAVDADTKDVLHTSSKFIVHFACRQLWLLVSQIGSEA